jgi:C4-dicarboxylate transporter, DctQ subunit
MTPEDAVRQEPVEVPQDALSRLIIPLGRPVSLAFLVITVIAFFEVLLRYVFNAPTIWVHEATIALTAICFAFGGAYCLATDRHIRVVLLYDAVGPRARRWLDIAISLTGAASCALMAWAAWGLASRAFFTPQGAFRLETSGSAWNPPTPAIVKGLLFLTICAMCGQFLLQALRHIRRHPSDSHHGKPGEGVFEDV